MAPLFQSFLVKRFFSFLTELARAPQESAGPFLSKTSRPARSLKKIGLGDLRVLTVQWDSPMADEKQSEPMQPKHPKPAEAQEAKPVEEMSEEEQLAAYEEEMKNSDWGHQPC